MRVRRFAKLFKLETGQKYGMFVERAFARMGGFQRSTDGRWDRDYKGLRIEFKAMRAVAPMESYDENEGIVSNLNRIIEDTMHNRALYSFDDTELLYGALVDGTPVPIGNQSFCQQVKPAQFDYLVACCVFLDVIRVFVIPSSDISKRVGRKAKGKLVMTEQHKNPKEGVLTLRQVEDYHVFDITDPISDFDNLEIDFTPYFKQRKRA